jgi:tetratricopeptide (TPR) repeat protein
MAAMGATGATFFFVLAAAVPAPAGTINLSGAKACFGVEGRPSLNAQIAGCTAVIASPLATPQIRASAHHNRGAAYNAKEEHYRAVFEFDKALALRPSAMTYAARGAAYFNMTPAYKVANLEKSVEDFQAALRLDPKLAFAQRGLKSAQHALDLAKDMAKD